MQVVEAVDAQRAAGAESASGLQSLANRKRYGQNVTEDLLRRDFSGLDLVDKLYAEGFLANLLAGSLTFQQGCPVRRSLVQRITFRTMF